MAAESVCGYKKPSYIPYDELQKLIDGNKLHLDKATAFFLEKMQDGAIGPDAWRQAEEIFLDYGVVIKGVIDDSKPREPHDPELDIKVQTAAITRLHTLAEFYYTARNAVEVDNCVTYMYNREKARLDQMNAIMRSIGGVDVQGVNQLLKTDAEQRAIKFVVKDRDEWHMLKSLMPGIRRADTPDSRNFSSVGYAFRKEEWYQKPLDKSLTGRADRLEELLKEKGYEVSEEARVGDLVVYSHKGEPRLFGRVISKDEGGVVVESKYFNAVFQHPLKATSIHVGRDVCFFSKVDDK